MSMLAFDTHKAVKALKDAGFDDSKAEAVVATVGDAIGGDIATKADIAELQATTKADIAELRAEIYRLVLTAVVSIIGLTTGLTVALVKLLP
ncbi:MAG: hypothetical protein OXF97_00585 [Nitrospira sp.]|nr:hypothetical protein [Nitrospira sp.]